MTKESVTSLNSSRVMFKTILPFTQALFTEFPALLKIVVFLGIWLGLWLPFAIPRSLRVKWRPGLPLSPEQRLPLLLWLYIVAPVAAGIIATLETSNFWDYGLHWETSTLASLGRGFAVGVFGLSLLFYCQSVFGAIDWTFPIDKSATEPPSILCGFGTFIVRRTIVWVPAFFLALCVAGIEEFMFRGVLQNLLQSEYSGWVAAATGSLIFALLHLIWDIPETLPQIPGLWVMGMVLAWARIVDGGSIALAWGIHAGWVWGLVCLDTAGIVRYTGTLPEWVSGLSGKPLAGLLGIVLLLATSVVIGH